MTDEDHSSTSTLPELETTVANDSTRETSPGRIPFADKGKTREVPPVDEFG